MEFDEGDEDALKSKDDNEIFEPKKPVVSKKKAKASTQPTPAKPVSPVKTQSRTVVTVKMVDLNDPEVVSGKLVIEGLLLSLRKRLKW